MKRGLVELDPAEAAERAQRVEALRERTRAAGAGLALIYGDVSRSDDIAYLTNLCIYWNEGVLAVPVDGEPALLAKLSKRVHPWMRATSTLEDLRSSPDLPGLVSDFAGNRERIALVDRELWPSALADGLERACAGAELVDLPDAVRSARLVPSPQELGLLRDAGSSLARALGAADAPAVERALRRGGATDAFVYQQRAADGTVSMDATVQQRTLWARAARAANGPAGNRLNALLLDAAAALRPGAPTPAAPEGAGLTCTSHADLATGGELRALSATNGQPLRPGEVVTLAMSAPDADGPAVAAGTYLVTATGTECLTGDR